MNYKISINRSFDCLIHVEFGHLQEYVSIQSFIEVNLELVTNKEVLELSLVSHLSKVNCAKIFKHWLYDLQNFIGKSFFVIKSKQEVNFSSFIEFSWIKLCVLCAISRALVWSGRIMKDEPKMMISNMVSGSSLSIS
jgi:hypothetical protein